MTPSNLRPTTGRSDSPDHSRGRGPQAIQAAFGCRSLGSAQKKIQRAFSEAERVSQVLSFHGVTAPIVATIARLHALLETGPVRPLATTLLADGHVSRQQDEARECCLASQSSPAALDLYEARVRREISEGFAALRDVAAHRRTAA